MVLDSIVLDATIVLFLVTKNAFEKKNIFLLKPQQNSQEITLFAQKYPFSG